MEYDIDLKERPVRVRRRLSADVVWLYQDATHITCNDNNQITYVVAETQCAENEIFFDGKLCVSCSQIMN